MYIFSEGFEEIREVCEARLRRLCRARILSWFYEEGFEGIREVCEAFSVPSFPSLRIRARIFFSAQPSFKIKDFNKPSFALKSSILKA